MQLQDVFQQGRLSNLLSDLHPDHLLNLLEGHQLGDQQVQGIGLDTGPVL